MIKRSFLEKKLNVNKMPGQFQSTSYAATLIRVWNFLTAHGGFRGTVFEQVELRGGNKDFEMAGRA